MNTTANTNSSRVKRRRSFEIKEKRILVTRIDELVSAGWSRRKACALMGIHFVYYSRWKKLLAKVDGLNHGDEFVSYNTTGTARRLHSGRKSALEEVKLVLKAFIFKIRESGVQVTNKMVEREASRLLPSFKNKTPRSKELCVFRFTRSLGLTQRAATHTAQKHFNETARDAKDFIDMVRLKLVGRNLDDVLNMDQTPIPFSYHSGKTLDVKGTKTIHARASTTDTKRVTLAATVSASGKMLTPYLIFKGKPNGRIATREFATFPSDGVYACQEKAWMDEARMHDWVEKVLMPWKVHRDANNPSVEPPLLILDAYRVHQMGSVVNRIQMMGIEVLHIPAGCTYLCQPIDVGINKPIKCGLRRKWEDWMVDGEGIVAGQAKEPSRKLIAEWLVEIYTNIPEGMGQNAWKKRGYEWVY
jgi:hypothetical protein